MNPEIQKLNEEITQDNDEIEKTLEATKKALDNNNEHLNKIKTYLSQQNNKIKNPHAQKFLLKIQTEINKTQEQNLKIKTKIHEEQNDPTTKTYTMIYQEGE